MTRADRFSGARRGRRAGVMLLAWAALWAPSLKGSEPSRPNVIVIFADDLGYADVGAQGIVKDVRTPHLDRLAAEGARCSAGYVTAPQCTPSRAGLLTGRYQQRFGIDSIPDGPLPLEERTIAERLQAAGYVSGMIGKWHLEPNAQCARWAREHLPNAARDRRGRVEIPLELQHAYYPEKQGFAEYFVGTRQRYWSNLGSGANGSAGRAVDDARFRIDAQADAACAFIERNVATPFFLYLCYFAPHVPLEATDEYLARFPGEMANRRRHALAMTSAMDDGVGRILKLLDEKGIDERTLIFFSSDNGAPLKLTREDAPLDDPRGAWDGSLNDPLVGEKGMVAEGGIRVPYLVRWKGVLPPGKVYEHAVSTLDIAATAVAMAGLPADPLLDGMNLIPFLKGDRDDAPHAELYWRFWNQAAIRAGNWKYIALGDGREYLFDLSSPEQERRNLLTRSRSRADNLRAKLAKWCDELQPPGLPAQTLNNQEQAWYEHYFAAEDSQ